MLSPKMGGGGLWLSSCIASLVYTFDKANLMCSLQRPALSENC